MKSKHLIGLFIMLLLAACGNSSEGAPADRAGKKADSSTKTNQEGEFAGDDGADNGFTMTDFAGNSEEKDKRSLEDSAAAQFLNIFGVNATDFNDLFKVDSLENSIYTLLTEESFKVLISSEDFSKEEIDDLLKAFKQKDSLDAQLIIAQKNGATKAEMEKMMQEHKETLKRISNDPDQIDELYSMLDPNRIDDALTSIGKEPIDKKQALVRRKLKLDDASYVEEKLTNFSMYGEAKRKETMEALKTASAEESDAIIAAHFGITEPEVALLKKLPKTSKIFAEDEAVAIRDFKLDPTISDHLMSGKASDKFKAQVKIFSDQRATQAKNFLNKADRARKDFYELNPGWYGEDQTTGVTYSDSRNKLIYLPLGELSFADRVISHDTGKGNLGSNKQGSTGLPDMTDNRFRNADPKVCNLGIAGVLTLEFTDNAIADVNGPDLYVFELGAIEPTNLEISKDGKEWINVGKIDGGTAFVDIGGFAKPGETYAFLRLTDLESPSALPGADVDAIAAIGGAVRLNIDSAVLFDTGEYTLKPSANDALNELVNSIEVFPSGIISVQGHTDNVGSPVSNQKLSLKRAQAVSSYISEKLSKKYTFKQVGYGQTQPVAANDTKENRQKNRRVEILVSPSN